MNQSEMRSPWEYTKGLLSLPPTVGNAAQSHAAVDRTGYRSAIIDIAFSCSGAPTGGTIGAKLQDSADGTNFADLLGPNGQPVQIQAALTAANAAGGILSLNGHLGAARQFVHAVTAGAPTGGNAPVLTVSATIRLYGPDNLPAL